MEKVEIKGRKIGKEERCCTLLLKVGRRQRIEEVHKER
jgi:hypothetical protein